MVENKLIITPFMTSCKLPKDMGPQSDTNLEGMWVILFQDVIGNLMYEIVCTRFDIVRQWGLRTNLWPKQIGLE
jgi:hypothetical protein